jgi:GNAT superfamily N-acetyltransferase
MPAGSQNAPKHYESVDSFREHWNALGVRNMTDIRAKGTPYEHIRPSEIEVDKASRNKGLGTAFMEDLVAFADLTGKQIRINPSDELGATSKGRLEKFYKRFGFVENKPGKNKDYAISERFYRQPSSGERFKATSEDIRFMPASDQDTKALQMLPKPRRSLDAAYRDGVKTRSQDPQYYDVPDYVGYDMARTAAFEMGREGAEPPRWVMAERIGKLPTEGRSKNFAEDRMERGVSVLRIVGEPQSDVGTYEMFNPGEKRYVAGWLVGLGSDGEPLLADAVDLGPASSDVRMMPSPDSAMPGAYSFPGGYRAIPGKAKGSLRLYGPAGSLIGIAASLDEAQRIIRKKSKQ